MSIKSITDFAMGKTEKKLISTAKYVGVETDPNKHTALKPVFDINRLATFDPENALAHMWTPSNTDSFTGTQWFNRENYSNLCN